MRAHTITTMTRHRRSARRVVIALVLGVCALAIPASASAVPMIPHPADYSQGRPPPGGMIGPYHHAHPGLHGTHGSPVEVSASPPPTSEPTVVLRRDGSQAEPTVVSDSPSASGDGFDWSDAAVGAGAAMALVALSGAALFMVRRRPGGLPSASTS